MTCRYSYADDSWEPDHPSLPECHHHPEAGDDLESGLGLVVAREVVQLDVCLVSVTFEVLR